MIPTETDADSTLIAAAQRGGAKGRAAFGYLVSRYNGWMLGYATSLLGNRNDAEDVAQDAFVRAYLALKRFRTSESVQAWLRVIATRLAFNRIRNKNTRDKYRTAFASAQRLADGDNTNRLAAAGMLSATLEGLSYPYREILILHHVEELKVREIAVVLGIGLSAAKMRLKRARAEFIEAYNRGVDSLD